jgi:CRP-like cAMP-binding protein
MRQGRSEEDRGDAAGRAESLGDLALFRHLDDEHLRRLVAVSTHLSYGKGELVERPEGGERMAFVVAQGTIRYSFLGARQELTVFLLERCDLFEFWDETDPMLRWTLVEAVRAGTVVWRMPYHELLHAVTRCPEAGERFIAQLEHRLIEASGAAHGLIDNPAARLRWTLRRHAQRNRRGWVPFTHEELARWSGMRRETVTRLLGRFEAIGLVERQPHRRGVRVPDIDRLLEEDDLEF